jgi:uncharacterized repeat protein (TIGR01451 family)
MESQKKKSRTKKRYKKMPHVCVILLLLLLTAIHLEAQVVKPGNTSYQVELWLKADSLQTTLPNDGANVSSWVDISGSGRNFTQSTVNYYPVYTYSGMNFHPAVAFRESSATASYNTNRRLINSNFPTNNGSYYTFFVSTVDAMATGNYATVFTSSTSNDQNGWRIVGDSTTMIYHQTRGTGSGETYTHDDIEKEYGIGAVIRPNTTSVNQSQYHNGIPNSAQISGRVMNTGNNTAVIGSRDNGNDDYFFGDIQEIIHLSAPIGTTIDATELAKIHTYLAIKYGQTMNDGFAYTRSDGVSLWNHATVNGVSYNSNIFGLGHDSESGLYQKQAENADEKSLIVYVGNLEDINSKNTGAITDKTYLLFGDNGETGFTPYTYNKTIPFENGLTVNDFDDISNKVWRTQMTGATSMEVSIKSPVAGAKYLMVSSDPAFPQGNTHIYPFDGSGVVAGLSIEAGDYITLGVKPQAPGGVFTNLKMWLSADDITSLNIKNGNEVHEWRDRSGNGILYYYNRKKIGGSSSPYNSPPLYVASDTATNYYPGVYFERTGGSATGSTTLIRYLSTNKGPMSKKNPDNYTILTVMYNDFGRIARTYFLSFGRNYLTDGYWSAVARPAFGLEGANNKVAGRYRQSSPDIQGNGSKDLYNLGATSLFSYEVKSDASSSENGYVTFNADGETDKLTDSRIGRSSGTYFMNGPGVLGSGTYPGRTMNGVMAEMIAYEGVMLEADKDKIYSSLGLKYGITIDKNQSSATVNFDYTLSTGEIVWPGTTNPIYQPYHHQVAAVIRDNAAGLNNKQSHSTDAGSVMKMGVGSSFNNLTGLQNDKEVIVWGDNGATSRRTPSVSAACGGLGNVWNRIWLVNKTTAVPYDVQIAAHASSMPYKKDDRVFLLIAQTSAEISADQWSRVIEGVYRDGEWHFAYQFPQGITYLAFGAIENKGICIDCAFSGTKSMNFKDWRPANRDINLGGGITATASVAVSAGVTSTQRRNSYNNSWEISRRNTTRDGVVTATIEFKNGLVSTPVIPTFSIYDIDRSSSLFDKVTVTGYCDNEQVTAILLNSASNPSTSVVSIEGHIAQAKAVSLSYSNTRGHLVATFTRAVSKIVIKYETTGASTGTQLIGIGPITLRCAPPPAPVNEDGLSFTKMTSSYNVSLCEDVTYIFSIKNTNCTPKTVNGFLDVLPEGMKWVANSVNSAVGIIDSTYAENDSLSISNLLLPGDSELFFQATATFDRGAPSKIYGNRAHLLYDRMVTGNSVPIDFESHGWNESAFAWENDSTYVNASLGQQLDEVTTYSSSYPATYTEDKENEISITIHNPNAYSIQDMQLHVTYDAGFTFVSGSYDPSITGTNIVHQLGEFDVDNFTLLPDTSYTFKFKLKAPIYENLRYQYDETGAVILDGDGDSIKVDLEVYYEFSTNDPDPCLVRTIGEGASGEAVVPYRGKSVFIIANKHVRSRFQ